MKIKFINETRTLMFENKLRLNNFVLRRIFLFIKFNKVESVLGTLKRNDEKVENDRINQHDK